MRGISTLALALLVALGGPAWGQANLRPDVQPRVPAQPGQIPPAEDVEFLKTATAMSRVEIQLGEMSAKASSKDVQQIGRRIADNQRAMEGEVAALAKQRGVDLSHAELAVPEKGGPGGAASAVTSARHASGVQAQQAVKRLSGLSGDEFNKAFIEEQLALHDRLVDLYQTEASNTPDTGLASFAIKALVTIQQDRDELRRLAGEMGIATGRTGQAPQYGEQKRR